MHLLSQTWQCMPIFPELVSGDRWIPGTKLAFSRIFFFICEELVSLYKIKCLNAFILALFTETTCFSNFTNGENF